MNRFGGDGQSMHEQFRAILFPMFHMHKTFFGELEVLLELSLKCSDVLLSLKETFNVRMQSSRRRWSKSPDLKRQRMAETLN